VALDWIPGEAKPASRIYHSQRVTAKGSREMQQME
jgi:hypothetical protein